MSALISTNQLTKRFGDLVAVDHVDFDLHAGEVVGLLGANGAGKTTVIRMILGLERPTSGTVSLLGGPPSREARARLGYVPQSLGLYNDLTVSENLEFVAEAFGTRMIALGSDLAGISDRTVGSISLGFRRRVAFAAALLHDPELLILDEPTSGVGPLGRAELWDDIGSAATNGVGVLVSTHYMEEAEQCDRLVMMSDGGVVATGRASDLTANIEVVQIDSDDWARTLEALTSVGAQVSINGGAVRAVGMDRGDVEAILQASNIEATTRIVAAGFEEAFVALAGH